MAHPDARAENRAVALTDPPAEAAGPPLRVALLNGSLPPLTGGGVGHQADLLARGLVDAGHDVTVFTTVDVGGPRAYHLEVLTRPSLPVSDWLLGNGLAFRRAELGGFDVAHAHGDSWGITGVPVVRTFHGTALDEALHAASWKRRLAQTAHYGSELIQGARATVTTTVSANARRSLPGIDLVIPNAVDNAVFFPTEDRFTQPTILMVAGHLGGRKRGALMLAAFARVRDVVPGVRLIIVTLDGVKMEDVETRRSIGSAELGELYRRSWVLASTSSYEGFGLPYAEAMASGLPIVTTSNKGARELLGSGSGMITDDDDNDIAAGLIRMLTQRDLASEYRRRGLAAATQYALEGVVARYVSAYRWAITRSTG